MKLYVARHGETQYNLEKRIMGKTDLPLVFKGIDSADKLGKNLSGLHIDVIVSSPLLRARQTADILSKKLKTPVVIEHLFKERDFGIFEGLNIKGINKLLSKNLEMEDFLHISKIENGESIKVFDLRIQKGLLKLKKNYEDKTVLLVAHGYVSRLINKNLNKLTYDEMHNYMLKNCEYWIYNL